MVSVAAMASSRSQRLLDFVVAEKNHRRCTPLKNFEPDFSSGIRPPDCTISSRNSDGGLPCSDLPVVRFSTVPPFDIDPDAIAGFDQIVDAGGFEQRQADLVAIAVEGPREQLGENGSDAGGLERLCGEGASRRAAEIAARHEDIAGFHVDGKIGIGGFENVLRHLADALPHDVSGRDEVGGNVVAELPAVPFENQFVFHICRGQVADRACRWVAVERAGLTGADQQQDQADAREPEIDGEGHGPAVRFVEEVAGQFAAACSAESEEYVEKAERFTDLMGSEVLEDDGGSGVEDTAVAEAENDRERSRSLSIAAGC